MLKLKKIIAIVLTASMAATALAATSCTGEKEQAFHSIHIDTDWDGICDTCGSPIDEASIVPEKPQGDAPSGGGETQTPDDDKPTDPEEPDDDTPSKPVARITIKSGPTKNEYFIGDEFVPDGGVLTVNYTDRTSDEISFSAEGVTFSNVDTSSSGSKTISVSYGGKKANFTINVIAVAGIVTFDMNYDVGKNLEVKVGEGRTIARPEDPERPDYDFFDWYADKECTVAYKFGKEPVTQDVTIYAAWKGQNDFVVTYDLNYYGIATSKYAQIVSSGQAARPITQPERAEFTFGGWFVDEQLTNEYTPGEAITADTVLRAKWNRVSYGSKTYTFEAENTDLTGKVGPGFSGESLGADMIVTEVGGDSDLGASGGRYVSSLYKKGLGLEFYIASSEAVTDAEISVSVAYDNALEKPGSLTFNCDEYQVLVNGKPMQFDDFTVVKGEKFSDKIVIKGVSLDEGYNFIQLLTNNDRHPWGNPGEGTYQGSAPVVDCIKITTTAVLMWDENYGLPTNLR